MPGLRARAEHGEIAFGTIDSWLIWNLTGGTDGGRHVTDVTNAGRTMLMNLETLQWDPSILSAMNVPEAVLPEIRSSAEVYGTAVGQLAGVPVASALGDQQAAVFGQACYDVGTAKNTYGTGSFLLLNTGNRPGPVEERAADDDGLQDRRRGAGLLPGGVDRDHRRPGAVVPRPARHHPYRRRDRDRWRRASRTTAARTSCPPSPACSRPTGAPTRAVSSPGLTRYVTKAHLARAVLEATSWQTREVVDAMYQDSGVQITTLKVDGGMTKNNLLMQHQADVLGVPVIRPKVSETTCLGAAYAAGLATGVWNDLDELKSHWQKDVEWTPAMEASVRDREYHNWRKAVEKSFGWEEDGSRDLVHGTSTRACRRRPRPVPRSAGVRAASVRVTVRW